MTEAEARARLLGEKISDIESKNGEHAGAIDDNYKKVNDKLTAKTKDMKKLQQLLKQAEDRAKDLVTTLQEKNKKISELENSNTRLRNMKDQATEFVERNSKPKETDDKAPGVERKAEKCKFENSGTCRKRSECKESHPRKTCQAYSKLGSCPLESACEHRHPFGVCYAWRKEAFCPDGEHCRHRHPFELGMQNTNKEHFLAPGSPSGRLGGEGQDSQRGQDHRHHDLRGNRW